MEVYLVVFIYARKLWVTSNACGPACGCGLCGSLSLSLTPRAISRPLLECSRAVPVQPVGADGVALSPVAWPVRCVASCRGAEFERLRRVRVPI